MSIQSAIAAEEHLQVIEDAIIFALEKTRNKFGKDIAEAIVPDFICGAILHYCKQHISE